MGHGFKDCIVAPVERRTGYLVIGKRMERAKKPERLKNYSMQSPERCTSNLMLGLSNPWEPILWPNSSAFGRY